MEMKKCFNGHYYDASIYPACPYCDKQDGATMPVTPPVSAMDDERTLPIGYQSAPAADTRMTSPSYEAPVNNDDDERTVPIFHKEMGVDPVVGWLVCINNSQKGRDYRIHSDNNYIGRSERMDVCIRGDETISRENHAIVSYDTVDNIYYFSPGDGRSIVRVNEKAVFATVELKAYDVITVGKTDLLFIPLCTDKFDWSAVK